MAVSWVGQSQDLNDRQLPKSDVASVSMYQSANFQAQHSTHIPVRVDAQRAERLIHQACCFPSVFQWISDFDLSFHPCWYQSCNQYPCGNPWRKTFALRTQQPCVQNAQLPSLYEQNRVAESREWSRYLCDCHCEHNPSYRPPRYWLQADGRPWSHNVRYRCCLFVYRELPSENYLNRSWHGVPACHFL